MITEQQIHRGRREYRALIGTDPSEGLNELALRAPQLHETLLASGFAGPLARPELSRRDRELATVAALAAIGGAERQLAVHAAAALTHDIAASELLALAEHVALYAGFPRALNAAATIGETIAQAGLERPPRLQRVKLPTYETLVAASGDSGPPVILLHALGLDWRMWEPVMPALAQGHRVFAYDIRGHGAAAGAPGGYAMTDVAGDLAGVMDALGVEEAHVVGLSYGGGIAQTFAKLWPERLASLSLLATTDHPFEAFEGRARSAETDGMEAQVAPSLTRWFTGDALAADGWGVRYAREQVRRGDAGDWAAAWRAFTTLDVQGRLAGLRAPALVMVGELDASTTPEIMTALAGRIPGATLEVLPRTPHMQTLEQPASVADTLTRFLRAAQVSR